jgi:hypothetical protein
MLLSYKVLLDRGVEDHKIEAREDDVDVFLSVIGDLLRLVHPNGDVIGVENKDQGKGDKKQGTEELLSFKVGGC